MEQHDCELIPPPTVVREELARNYEQARLLRRLLRLSEDAAVESHRRVSEHRPRRKPQPEAARPGGAAHV
jgi:hypothetical protein